MPHDPFLASLAGTLLAALATGVGGLLVFLRPEWRERPALHLFTVAGGLMLGASVLSLALPAARLLAPRLGDGSFLVGIAAGLALGGLGFRWMAAVAGRAEAQASRRGPWLVVLALAIHNVPEGLAVSTALGGPDVRVGLPVLLGMVLHNVPEGLAAALAASTWGWSPRRAALMALATGLVEPLAGLAGGWAVSRFTLLLPWILLGTAGAMIEMVRLEILPRLREKAQRIWLPVLVAVILLAAAAAALLQA